MGSTYSCVKSIKKNKMSEEQTPVAKLGAKENPIVVEEDLDGVKLVSLLIKSVTDIVIQREIILLSNEINKYRKYISTRMLACEDERLMEMAKLENFSEAFTEGWKTGKNSNEDEAFNVFSNTMLK